MSEGSLSVYGTLMKSQIEKAKLCDSWTITLTHTYLRLWSQIPRVNRIFLAACLDDPQQTGDAGANVRDKVRFNCKKIYHQSLA